MPTAERSLRKSLVRASGYRQSCRLITEVHSNIAQEGKGVSCQLADVLAVLAHELDGERLLRDLAISMRDTK